MPPDQPIDADELLMALDATEEAGAPPHLVDLLRRLVRTWGNLPGGEPIPLPEPRNIHVSIYASDSGWASRDIGHVAMDFSGRVTDVRPAPYGNRIIMRLDASNRTYFVKQ